MEQKETYENGNLKTIESIVQVKIPVTLIARVKSAAALDVKPDGKRTTANEKYLECIELGLQVLEQRKSA